MAALLVDRLRKHLLTKPTAAAITLNNLFYSRPGTLCGIGQPRLPTQIEHYSVGGATLLTTTAVEIRVVDVGHWRGRNREVIGIWRPKIACMHLDLDVSGFAMMPPTTAF